MCVCVIIFFPPSPLRPPPSSLCLLRNYADIHFFSFVKRGGSETSVKVHINVAQGERKGGREEEEGGGGKVKSRWWPT